MKNQSDRNLKRSSFTLIEISVVLAIIALFLALAFPRIPVFKEEAVKSEARKLVAFFSKIIDKVSRDKKSLKLLIKKREKKIEVLDCVPINMTQEEKQRYEKISEQLKGFFGKSNLPFLPVITPQVPCEWKKQEEIKLSSDITSLFVDAEETFGKEVEILLQSSRIPLVEIELEKKIWVNLNPYTFRVYVGEEPIHFARRK
ncbi:hypothetical protein HRbin19_01644 [bacterium HR19]|nr:hypothetical protein HRbin19_01644 [bacterium HR19]